MAFTPNDDLNIIQASDSATVSAGAGDDTYILSAATIGAGQQVTISDTQGVNTLQLVGGLTIASSSVANDAVQLTLSNGAVVTLLSASAFNFNVGGNALAGIAGTNKDYATFAQEDLGVTVPAEGEAPENGGESTIGEGPVDPEEPTDPTFTLTKGLEDLAAANAAKSDLLQDTVAANEDVAADLKGGTAAVADNPTDAEIETALANVLTVAQGAVAAEVATIANATAYAANSDALNAALIGDQQKLDSDDLAAKEKTLATETANVAKVTGLQAALDAVDAAEKADIAADTAATAAATAYTAALNNFDVALESAEGSANDYTVAATLTGAGTAGDKIVVTDNTGAAPVVTEVIVYDATTKAFKLGTGVTEADFAGVTDVLSAINANIAAIKAATATQAALDSATLTADYIDTYDAGVLAKAVAAEFIFTTEAIADMPSDAEIQAEKELIADKIDALDALVFANGVAGAVDPASVSFNAGDNISIVEMALATNVDAATDLAAAKVLTQAAYEAGYISLADKTAIDNGYTAAAAAKAGGTAAITDLVDANVWQGHQAALVAAEGALNTSETVTEDTALTNGSLGAVSDAYIAADDAVTAAKAGIAALDKALAELATIEALDASVDAADEVIAAAEKAFSDNDLTVPVTLDGGIKLGTAENDVFVAATTDTEVRSMGVLGEDILYVGDAVYNNAKVVVAGADADAGEVLLKNAGDDAVVEFFLEETATGVNVHIEEKAFASSVTDFDADVTTITLTGVELADITVDGGFITVA